MSRNRFLAAVGFAAAVFTGISGTANAEQISSKLITPKVVAEVHEWLNSPVVFISLKAQNKRHADLDATQIEELDKQWRAERDAEDQPLIAATLSSPLSSYLTQVQASSGGLFTEIFVMDAKGLNVGQSAVTSDYWQGDEAKFDKTFNVGKDAVFIDEPELHEGTGTWRAQLNLSISEASEEKQDGEEKTGAIGAVTIEINLTELARLSGIKE